MTKDEAIEVMATVLYVNAAGVLGRGKSGELAEAIYEAIEGTVPPWMIGKRHAIYADLAPIQDDLHPDFYVLEGDE